MKPNKKQLLLEIQALQFSIIELTLFLDTHPTDDKAIIRYNMDILKLRRLKKSYETIYGPLSSFGCSNSEYPWQWIDEPWPWEL